VIEGDFQAPNWLDLQRLHHNRAGIDTGTLAGFGPAAMMANDNDLIRSSPIPA